MKTGLSTYSLLAAIKDKRLDVLQGIDWIAAQGGEHVEIVPFGYQLVGNDPLIDAIRDKAASVGLDISNYAILADLLQDDEGRQQAEIDRLKREVDIAARLGVKRMRHDVSAFRRPADRNTILHYQRELPRMVRACREIADYAKQYDITTTVENHGFYVNGSDRIIQLIDAVDRDNFRMTLDVGNFLCIDEDAVIGVKKSLSFGKVEMIHLKDFYVRPSAKDPGGTTEFDCFGQWFKSVNGNYLRGAIINQGDLDMQEILSQIKMSGYDGCISLEFEGMEDCLMASQVGMANIKRIWSSIAVS